jgi:hypothetical protein
MGVKIVEIDIAELLDDCKLEFLFCGDLLLHALMNLLALLKL